jgi:hypothetical protein
VESTISPKSEVHVVINNNEIPGLQASFTMPYQMGPSAGDRLKGSPVIRDEVDIKGAGDESVKVSLAALKQLKMNESEQSGKVSLVGLAYPALTQAAARNNTPVIVVHGTLREKESISKYNEASLAEGHPTDFSTYLTIKEGERIEVSGQIISRSVNEARMDVARKNLKELRHVRNDEHTLMAFFSMSPDLYGETDKSTGKIAALLPGVIDRMDDILSMRNETLAGSLSTRLKDYQKQLAAAIMTTGFASSSHDVEQRKEVVDKCAAEIIESIAPKPFLVGHSMGGFVSYVIGVNPKENIKDKDPCTFDAGNGVSTVMVLSSPIARGVRKPLPTGLSSIGFDLYEKNVLNPLEHTPAMELAMMNPLFAAWYASSKAISKESSKQMTEASASFMNPYIYAQKPGYEQIAEGSSFIRDHLEGKKVPYGTTVVAVTNKLDGVSEADRSKADESQPNAHNLDAEVKITPDDLKDPMDTLPRVAHFKMADYPIDHWGELKKEICQNPVAIPRILDRKNHDGIRYNTLMVLLGSAIDDRAFFKKPEMKNALQAIRDTAGEKLPFSDSPAYVAWQILNVIDNNADIQKPHTGSWALSATFPIPVDMKTWPSTNHIYLQKPPEALD